MLQDAHNTPEELHNNNNKSILEFVKFFSLEGLKEEDDGLNEQTLLHLPTETDRVHRA